MTGRVALQDRRLRARRAQVVRRSACRSATSRPTRCQLSEEARGKRRGRRDDLPLPVRRAAAGAAQAAAPRLGEGRASPTTSTGRPTIIAAFSFLFHFGAVGSIYSDWMDPIVDDEVDVAQLLESVKQLPAAASGGATAEEDAETPVATAAAADAGRRRPTAAASGGSGCQAPGGRLWRDQRRPRVGASPTSWRSSTCRWSGALNSSGGATASVLELGRRADRLRSKTRPPQAPASARAAWRVEPGRRRRWHCATWQRPAAVASPRSATPRAQRRTGDRRLGDRRSRGPSATLSMGGAAVSGGSVSNAPSVVAGMAAGFRRCYNKGLQEDPNMKGSVRVTAKIGPNGEVLAGGPLRQRRALRYGGLVRRRARPERAVRAARGRRRDGCDSCHFREPIAPDASRVRGQDAILSPRLNVNGVVMSRIETGRAAYGCS